MRALLLFHVFCLGFWPTRLAGQLKAEYEMGQMQMILLHRVKDAPTKPDPAAVFKEHRAHVERLLLDGKVALPGEVAAEETLREFLIVKSETPEPVRAIAEALPAVRAGLVRAEVVGWYGARNLIKPPVQPLAPAPYIFGTLMRGAKPAREQNDENRKLQEAHLANINRLHEEGKLVLAGPFTDASDRRGIFIFKVDTLQEAQELTASDPAVKAGRLRIELVRVTVPKGILP